MCRPCQLLTLSRRHCRPLCTPDQCGANCVLDQGSSSSPPRPTAAANSAMLLDNASPESVLPRISRPGGLTAARAVKASEIHGTATLRFATSPAPAGAADGSCARRRRKSRTTNHCTRIDGPDRDCSLQGFPHVGASQRLARAQIGDDAERDEEQRNQQQHLHRHPHRAFAIFPGCCEAKGGHGDQDIDRDAEDTIRLAQSAAGGIAAAGDERRARDRGARPANSDSRPASRTITSRRIDFRCSFRSGISAARQRHCLTPPSSPDFRSAP